MNILQRAILRFSRKGRFDGLPDALCLRILYFGRMMKWLHLKNPKTFNEKLQWLKLYDRKPEYTMMVDKYEVKKYISDTIGAEYVIPTLGVWNHFDEIDFDALPDQFVLKCTHDSGGLVICRDKAMLDKAAAKAKIERCLGRNYYYSDREWPYKNVVPRIIAEQYMEDENETSGLRDYKFFCFNKEPKMVYISEGLEDHSTARISFYDLNRNAMPFGRSDYQPIMGTVKWPENYEKMKTIARAIAKKADSPFVRVDLYSIEGKIFFSEITFTPCAGMMPFNPKEWDRKLGDWIKLPVEE